MEHVQKKKLNIFIKIAIGIIFLFLLIILALFIYSSNSYQASDDMYTAINQENTSSITVNHSFGSITYTVDNPTKNIIFIPGGLVDPESYMYLATNLALSGYDVTIVKPWFNLAIISPNQAAKYINEDLDNVIIGHSLGGVVAGMVASNHQEISTVIMLAAYPTTDLTDKDVLMITASNDLVLDQSKYDESLSLLNTSTEYITIDGGNHGGFGWYGAQSGDGVATITTQEQQDTIVNDILTFMQS